MNGVASGRAAYILLFQHVLMGDHRRILLRTQVQLAQVGMVDTTVDNLEPVSAALAFSAVFVYAQGESA